MEIKRICSGTPWEDKVGYCRVLRAGNLVWTSGTVAADDQGAIHGSDVYEQCCYIFEKLQRALSDAGSSLDHAVKVTSYITDIDQADGFTRAHKQYVGEAQPVCTCVVVAGLFCDALVELEVTAIIPQQVGS
jgi:enamine deaminase RidA (YjgF/YER057c/UK114 family)